MSAKSTAARRAAWRKASRKYRSRKQAKGSMLYLLFGCVVIGCVMSFFGCNDKEASSPSSAARPLRSPTATPFYTYYDRDNGDAVSELQNELKALNYYFGEITGFYDELTAEAVMGYQIDNGLDPSGIADDETLALLFGKDEKE